MKQILLLAALLCLAYARPEGYYHQESEFHSSKAAYKNDELQQKEDDDGFYSEHGDLEGKTKPKVNSYSQHAQYVNPNLRNQNQGLTASHGTGQGIDDSFYGSSNQGSGSSYGTRTRGTGSSYTADSQGTGSSYGTGTGSSYGAGTGSRYGAASSSYGAGSSYRAQSSYGAEASYGVGRSYSGTDGTSGSTSTGTGSNYRGAGSGYETSSSNRYSGGQRQTSYGVASNLEDLTQRLEDDLAQQLQTAISQQYRQSASYAESSSVSRAQMQTDLRHLEEELKANLTKKLQEALYEKYGQQRINGPYSYSISSSVANPTANYDNQKLVELKDQVETNLLNQLQQTVQSKYESRQSTNTYGTSNNYNYNRNPDYTYTPRTTQTRPVPLSANTGYDNYDSRPQYTSANQDYHSTKTSSQNQYSGSYESSTSSISLTDIATGVQNTLSVQIDQILQEQEQRHLNLIQMGRLPNYTETFEYLKGALKHNLTTYLDEEITKHYGTQIRAGEYSYSVLPSGERKTRPSFRYTDLQLLKQQVEDNLVEKLSYGIRQQESTNTQRQQTYSSNSNRYENTNVNYGGRKDYSQQSGTQYGTNGFRTVVLQPLSADSQTSSSSNFNRALGSQTSSSGYETNPNSEVELHNIQRELQNDLSRQLQTAIQETRKEFRSYSSSSSSGNITPSPETYQSTLNELTEELKRNLTREIQQSLNQHYGSQRTQGAYSYSVSSGNALRQNANYNTRQLEELQQQLQSDLLKQLQEGLQQSAYNQYSSHSSSASSSSSYQNPSYTKTGSSGYAHGQYKRYGGAQSYSSYGADCEDGHSLSKRDVRRQNPIYRNPEKLNEEDIVYGQIPDYDIDQGLTQQVEYEPGQYFIDDMQYTEDLGYPTPFSNSKDLNQEKPKYNEFDNKNYPSLAELMQEMEDLHQPIPQVVPLQVDQNIDDLTQQTEDISSQFQEQNVQKIENFTPQEVDNIYSKPKSGYIEQIEENVPQYIDQIGDNNPQFIDSMPVLYEEPDDLQQTEDLSQYPKKDDLLQQEQIPPLKFEERNDLQQTEDLTQNVDLQNEKSNIDAIQKYQNNDDLLQQTEDLTQPLPEEDDLQQQTEDFNKQFQDQFGDLTQKTEDVQETDFLNSDLTQQTEDLSPQFEVNNDDTQQIKTEVYDQYPSTYYRQNHQPRHQHIDRQFPDDIREPLIQPKRTYDLQQVDDVETIGKVEKISEEKPGFWGRIKNKIQKAYHDVKAKLVR